MPPRPQSTDELRFFDPRAHIAQAKNRLPHWDQHGVACFITFRLADSIPQEKLAQWGSERSTWFAANPPPHSEEQERAYHARFTACIEEWLDAGSGSCVLRDPSVRVFVAGALTHFDGDRHWQHAAVVMPNHVHALFSPLPPHEMEVIVQSWKGFTARMGNRHLARTGEFWMKDYFDRLIRDAAHFWRCARYIRRNSEKASLRPDEFTLYEAPFVREFLDAERSGGFPAAGQRS
ncbi:MAG: hypothetical protein RLZZ15_155 [Verrucomicrobiota bacterium]|jgi:hypothetical protein